MPYILRHAKRGGYEVVKRATGEVVAHSKTLAGARGYAWHASKGDKKPVHHGKKVK